MARMGAVLVKQSAFGKVISELCFTRNNVFSSERLFVHGNEVLLVLIVLNINIDPAPL